MFSCSLTCITESNPTAPGYPPLLPSLLITPWMSSHHCWSSADKRSPGRILPVQTINARCDAHVRTSLIRGSVTRYFCRGARRRQATCEMPRHQLRNEKLVHRTFATISLCYGLYYTALLANRRNSPVWEVHVHATLHAASAITRAARRTLYLRRPVTQKPQRNDEQDLLRPARVGD